MKTVYTKAILLAGIATALPMGVSTQVFAASNLTATQGPTIIQKQTDQGQNNINVLSIGNQGPEVATLQDKLHSLGYTIAPDTDGFFGGQTQRAVESYQQSNHLAPNGSVDPTTWKCLLNQVPGNTSSPSLGSQGADVAALQDKLRALGYTIAPDTYSSFGAQTQRAVQSYQRSNHLMASGIVDPTTWAYLAKQAPNSTSPTLSIGSKGSDVATLQDKLHSLGYTITPDASGTFGAQTQRAVQSYQKSNQITPDGIMNSATWKCLLTATGGSVPTLSANPAPSSTPSPSVPSTAKSAIEKTSQPVEQKQEAPTEGTKQGTVKRIVKTTNKVASKTTPTKENSLSSQPINESQASIIPIAEKYIGSPYVWGGTSPAGFDCSGFVQYVFAKVGISLPHSSSAMYSTGTSVNNYAAGDLVFFNTSGTGISHVGIYIGNDKFISATSNGVKIDSLKSSYWGSRFIGATHL